MYSIPGGNKYCEGTRQKRSLTSNYKLSRHKLWIIREQPSESNSKLNTSKRRWDPLASSGDNGEGKWGEER